MSGFDLMNYLGVFLDEVDEQLQILDSEILTLEKQPEDINTIINIFRAAHTLKGSSASMGFEKMKLFTHHLENVFEQIRQRKLQVTPEIITMMFDSTDVIRALKQAIIDENLELIDISKEIERLDQLIHMNTDSSPQSILLNKKGLDQFQMAILQKGIEIGHRAVEIIIQLKQDSLMKNVRALLVHNQLKDAGEIIATSPSVDEMEKDDQLEGDLQFIMLTMQTTEELIDGINQISNIDQIVVHSLEDWIMNSAHYEQEQQTSKKDEVNNNIHISDHDDQSMVELNPSHRSKVAPTVRVDVDKLEHLMNLVGELVIDQTRLIDVRGRLFDKDNKDETEFEILDEVTNHLGRVVAELQEGMMKTRMLPIEQLFNRFPRMVRDTSIKANKDIEFLMEGKETELDRTLIEEVSDPIIHLLRNAIDHGIESPEVRAQKGKPQRAKVVLKAAHEENHIVITITDDGKGINHEKIKQAALDKGMITQDEASKLSPKDAVFLIFKSGISTAEQITDISGRGVGMDIVKSHIEKLNGIIDIDTKVDVGTTFTIKLPLTLAIIRSLLVKLAERTFAIPLVNVLEIIRLDQTDIQMVKNQEVGMVRGRVLPLVRMKKLLKLDQMETEYTASQREFVIVIGIADKRIGIIADKMVGNQEIVIKSLGSYIGSPPFISGATIMGDGSVALILDVSSIVRECGMQVDSGSTTINQHVTHHEEQQLVTFKIGDEEYGIEIEKAKDIITIPKITKVMNTSEEMLGIINLRGAMLPVIDLKQKFNLKWREPNAKSRIIIIENNEQDVGILVDEVTQVLKVNQSTIEQPKEEHHYNTSKLIKGISKLNDRIVLILEFKQLLKQLNDETYKEITTGIDNQ